MPEIKESCCAGGSRVIENPDLGAVGFDALVYLLDGNINVACDTEFKGPHTLTIQFAAHRGDDIVVQVYSSLSIPIQPGAGAIRSHHPSGLESQCRKVVIRKGQTI